MAAYQSLGQFIATFAEPGMAGFRITEDGLKPCQKVLNSFTTSTVIAGVSDHTQEQTETTHSEDSCSDHRYVGLESTLLC